jgi:hypothetical protein
MKQTAVEWLIEQFKEYDFEDSPTMYIMQIPSWVLEKKELQAKEMEKQQKGYSKEEVENILIEYVKTNPTKPYRVVSWFEQFKNK